MFVDSKWLSFRFPKIDGVLSTEQAHQNSPNQNSIHDGGQEYADEWWVQHNPVWIAKGWELIANKLHL